jgi:acyl carrier protein
MNNGTRSAEIKHKLIEFLCINFIVDEDEIDMDESLIDQGIIDSFGLVEIAAFLEKDFGQPIKQEQMIRDNFGSVNKIVRFVEKITA